MISEIDYEGIKLLFQGGTIVKLKYETIFVLMCFVMIINWLILFIYQIRGLEVVWIYC